MLYQRIVGSALAATVLAISFAISAEDANGTKLLETLQAGLTSARSLPNGSRPAPPDLELKDLVGLDRSSVRRFLDRPSYCEPEESNACAQSASWTYVWGPPSAPPEERDGYIIVTTGGPWLLVVEFAKNRVSGARWQGQR